MTDPRFLAPLFAVVGVILVSFVWMYATRLTVIFARRVNPQDLADAEKFDRILKDVVNPSDNFENQFELPVLCAIALVVFAVTGYGTAFDLALAWGFAATRAVHLLVHCTSNRIRHRFAAYALGAIALWTLWIRLAWTHASAISGA